MPNKKKLRRKGPEVPDEMLQLPKRLKDAMRARDVNQIELASRTGVSQSVISKILTAESLAGVTAVVIARIAIGLDVPSGWLLTGELDAAAQRLAADFARRSPALFLFEDSQDQVPEVSTDVAPRGRTSKKTFSR